MKNKENYIKYFTDNVDEFELPVYVCQAMFNLMKLANMSEEEIYKNNKKLIDSKKYIYKQNIKLKNKDDEINYWKNDFKKASNALDIKLNRKPMRYVSDYISLADSIKAANKLNKEAEEAADEFHKLFEL